MKTYQYILSLDDASPSIVTPIVDGAQTYEYSAENEQMFFRKKLAGKPLVFCNDDFDIINDAAFETKFTIDLSLLNSSGIFITDFVGIFYKTDCDFDLDAKQVTVQPEPSDNYKKVIEGLDKEFDLIDLAPPTVELDYKRHPVFQILFSSSVVGISNLITNVIGGTSYQIPSNAETLLVSDLTDTYHFARCKTIGNVVGSTGLDPDISGVYIEHPTLTGWERLSDGKYRITKDETPDPDKLLVIDQTTTTTVYEAIDNSEPLYDTWVLNSLTTSSTARFIVRRPFVRYLTNDETIDGISTHLIDDNDPVTNPGGYTRCVGIGFTADSGAGTFLSFPTTEDIFDFSNNHTTTPTSLQRIPSSAPFFAGEYFDFPTSFSSGEYVSVDRSNWVNVSFWFKFSSGIQNLQDIGIVQLTEKNAYKVSDVLQTILTELGTGLTFDETTDCSEFFFDGSNPIRTVTATPVVIPKSNIIVGEYSEPAKKAPIKLSDVLNLLWGAYKCRWHINGTDFVVEHIEYYQKGQSYTTNNIGTDLTTLTEPKTALAWSYNTSKWKYDKVSMPFQIRFNWMDDSSEAFDGFPIDIRSDFADQGNIEEINIARFTSDIDYIQLAPENVSKDGFFFGEATVVSTRLTLPFVTLDLGNTGEYKVQNGYASMLYLHDKYHKYVLPASLVTINLEDVTASSVKRTRIQEIELPSDVVTEADTMELITLNLGDGRLRSMTDNTDGTGAKLIIEHEI